MCLETHLRGLRLSAVRTERLAAASAPRLNMVELPRRVRLRGSKVEDQSPAQLRHQKLTFWHLLHGDSSRHSAHPAFAESTSRRSTCR